LGQTFADLALSTCVWLIAGSVSCPKRDRPVVCQNTVLHQHQANLQTTQILLYGGTAAAAPPPLRPSDLPSVGAVP